MMKLIRAHWRFFSSTVIPNHSRLSLRLSLKSQMVEHDWFFFVQLPKTIFLSVLTFETTQGWFNSSTWMEGGHEMLLMCLTASLTSAPVLCHRSRFASPSHMWLIHYQIWRSVHLHVTTTDMCQTCRDIAELLSGCLQSSFMCSRASNWFKWWENIYDLFYLQ